MNPLDYTPPAADGSPPIMPISRLRENRSGTGGLTAGRRARRNDELDTTVLRDEMMRILQVGGILVLALAALSALSGYGKTRDPICDCPHAGCCRSAPSAETPTAIAPARPSIGGQSDAETSVQPASPEAEVGEFRPDDATPAAEPELSNTPAPESTRDLDQILAHWEKANRQIRRVRCEFTRFKFDRNLAVKTRFQGRLTLERGPWLVILRQKPYISRLMEAFAMLSRWNTQYAIWPDDFGGWPWISEQAVRIDPGEQAYESRTLSPNGPIPLQLNIADLRDILLIRPFLLGMPAAEVKRRFTVTIESHTPYEVRVKLVPRLNEATPPRGNEAIRYYDHAVLILDPKTGFLKGLQIRDLTGAETVHVFQNMVTSGWDSRTHVPTPPNL
jgi:hypothetical protein